MSYQKALDEGEVNRLNLKSVRAWIESSKGKIKAKPNKSIFYAGRDYDLEVIKDLPLADRKEFMGTPMWKVIERTRQQQRDLKLPCDFDTLEDVLKSIRDHPKVFTRDRQELRFANAFEFFSDLDSLAKLLPDAKQVARASWERLSEIYASNATGYIRILDGAADDYGKLGKDKILLRKELETLLKNKDLSPAGKAVLAKKISKYGDFFDRRYTDLMRVLMEDKKRLKPR